MTFRQQCRLLGKTARRPVLSVPTNQPCGVGVKMPLDFSQDYSALCRTNQALPHPSRIRSDYCQSASPGQCRQRSLTVKRKLSLCLLLLFSFPKPTAEQDCLTGCGSSCQAEQRPSGTLMPRCTHSCQSLWVTGRVPCLSPDRGCCTLRKNLGESSSTPAGGHQSLPHALEWSRTSQWWATCAPGLHDISSHLKHIGFYILPLCL